MNAHLYQSVNQVVKRHEDLYQRLTKLKTTIANIKFDGVPNMRDIGEKRTEPFARILIGGVGESGLEEFEVSPIDVVHMLEDRLDALQSEFDELDELLRIWHKGASEPSRVDRRA